MIQRLLAIFNKLDWFFGALFVGVGVYFWNWWIVAGGIVGLLSAYYQPARYLKEKLEAKILAKGAPVSDNETAMAEDAFYANFTELDTSAASAGTPDSRGGTFQIWGIAHNHLCPGVVGTFTLTEKQLGPTVAMLKRSYY